VELLGRRRERAVLDRLVQAVRGGESWALVLGGEPGIGKTALLDYVAGHAPGCRVIRAAGVQSEMELAFAGLHQLCGPMLGRLDRLPPPQADALRVAFGVASGSAPDRFLVGLAVLNLLSYVAEEQPLICLIDDEQWLDRASAQVFAFVARRLATDSVGLIFSARVPTSELAGLPDLTVEGLRDSHARALLNGVLVSPLDARVRDQIVAETHGNPLAILELARGLSPGKIAGGFRFPGAVPLSSIIEAGFDRQIDALPSETQRLIHLAAADPVGDPVVLWQAAEHLGIMVDAATPAAGAGLVEFGARVQFRHPLVRSAAYRAAPLRERQHIHRALADVTPDADADRRAWHRAEAALGPDEEVAGELERAASRAQGRGGLAAAAAFLERAALLTPDPEARARRVLAAASATRDAGALEEALTLLAAAEGGSLDARSAAEAERLRGRIAFEQARWVEAARLLLNAATRLEPIDAAAARETYLEGLQGVMWIDELDDPAFILAAAEAARAVTRPEPPRLVDVLLDAWAIRMTEGYSAAAPAFTDALNQLRALSVGDEADRLLWATGGANASSVALELWDPESWHTLVSRQVQSVRETGATVHLQFALHNLAWTHIFAGELTSAARLVDEDRLIADATGNPPIPWHAPVLAAWRGREGEASVLIDAIEGAEIRSGGWLAVVRLARSVLYNGLGRYDAALDSARPLFEHEYIGYPFAVFELAEAASRTGDSAMVATALEWTSERARTTGSEWALGTQAVIHALLSEGEVAEQRYRDSIAHLARTRMRPYLARTHLLYGEWLRRLRRRIDAREQLHTAYEMLSAMGIEAFAERARRELMATGVTVRKRTAVTGPELTAQEAQIARLARDGLSNPDIGSRMFISARTVKYHLSKVYTKLSITSREQLDSVLPIESTAAGRR
jgi:DNA-binding CsgD family transcriptional regulator